MGIEAAILGPLIGGGLSAFGNILGTAMQPNVQPQRRVPFTGAVAPDKLLGTGMSGIAGLMGTLSNKLQNPSSMSTAYAQPVPGLRGMDPAYLNRDLLKPQPVDFSPAQQVMQHAASPVGQAPNPGAASRRRPPGQPSLGQAVERSQSGPIRLDFGGSGAGSTPNAPQMDPRTQASIDLLMNAARQRNPNGRA